MPPAEERSDLTKCPESEENLSSCKALLLSSLFTLMVLSSLICQMGQVDP